MSLILLNKVSATQPNAPGSPDRPLCAISCVKVAASGVPGNKKPLGLSGAVVFRHTYGLEPHPFPGKGPSEDMHKISYISRSCQLHFVVSAYVAQSLPNLA